MFRITFYHLMRNWRTTALMVLALSVTFFFPMLSNALSRVLYAEMMQRAEETPLIVAAPGSRFVAVLNTVYFQSETLDPLPMRAYNELRQRQNVRAVPIYNLFRARVPVRNDFISVPIIATTHDYFHFRGLTAKEGGFFVYPGEIVIGHELARQSGLEIGDSILSEISSLINLNTIYPLSLKVVGILEETGTVDDNMIFSDLRSGWIMSGHFHGHEAPLELGEDYILSAEDDLAVMRRNVITYTEVTRQNLDSFHFHGDRQKLPLTAVIVIPQDERALVITAGRINAEGLYRAHRPDTVMEEFFGIVFAVNKIFNSYFALMLSAVVCFIAIIVLLSSRLRKDEFRTIRTLGGSRFMILKLYLCEYAILLAVSLLFSSLLTWQTLSFALNLFM